MRQLIVVVGCLLLVVTFLSPGCSTPRDDHIRSYNMQLASPRSTINVYSSSYVANKARCNPKDRMTWSGVMKQKQTALVFSLLSNKSLASIGRWKMTQ